MTEFEFTDAVRANVSLLILIAGGTGSGKTESAMRVATGLSGGKPFAVIDTENGRALHKADLYDFKHTELDEPFTPERYTEAVKAADDAGFPVIVLDSGSHVYDGLGGVLDIQEEEFKRMGERESARMSSWAVPKRRHKMFVQNGLLRTSAHVILCLRAEDKIEMVKVDGKTVVRPKAVLKGGGLDGWLPICEKRLPFEATVSLLLTSEAPGVPKVIKIEGQLKDLIPLDRELDENVGKALAKWAAGGSTKRRSGETPATGSQPPDTPSTVEADGPDSPPPLSAAAFKHQCAAAIIAPPQIREVGKRLYPGRTAASLTDEERGVLFAELLAEKDAQQVIA